MWNAVSAQSGIEIDPWFPDSSLEVNEPDINIRATTDDNSGGCASYQNSTANLNYGPSLQNLIKSNTSLASTIWAHEIGHALGLADAGLNPSPASIMNNGSTCGPPPPPTTSPLPSDGTVVKNCSAQTKAYQNQQNQRTNKHPTKAYVSSDTSSYSEFSYNCSETYALYDYYINGDYEYSEEILQSSTCNF